MTGRKLETVDDIRRAVEYDTARRQADIRALPDSVIADIGILSAAVGTIAAAMLDGNKADSRDFLHGALEQAADIAEAYGVRFWDAPEEYGHKGKNGGAS